MARKTTTDPLTIVKQAWSKYAGLVDRTEAARVEAEQAMVTAFAEAGASYRDIAAGTGLSHQRVAQIVRARR
jgi:hypothetical protein